MVESLSVDGKDHVVARKIDEDCGPPCCSSAAVDSERGKIKERVNACKGAGRLPVRMSLREWIEWSKGQEK